MEDDVVTLASFVVAILTIATVVMGGWIGDDGPGRSH
jgi:hypothetical protein